MKKAWISAVTLLAVLVLLVGMGAVACNGNGDENGTPPPADENSIPDSDEGGEASPPDEEEEEAPALPKPGDWVVSTGCEEFILTFTVSPDSAGITEITYSLFAFECAGWVQTVVSSTIEESPPWPIADGQFTIEAFESLGSLDLGIVIQGSFDETGTCASGTWEISVGGTACSPGSWEASAP